MSHILGGITSDAIATTPEDETGLAADATPYIIRESSEKSKTTPPFEEKSVNGILDQAIQDSVVVPTAEELTTLRRVSGKVSLVAYALCIVEFSERASYYGCSFIFSNFIQFPLPAGGDGSGAPPKGTQETAGALNKGLQTSSALTLLFQFLAYTLPIFGGWLADVHLGRYKVICIGVAVMGLAHIILVVGALPNVLQAGHGVAPFVIGILTLALGAGLFKSNIAPTLLDQDTQQALIVKELNSGERVILDPEVTAQKVLLAFYGLINVGAFFGLATTYAEKDVGYWLAFSLPGFVYLLLPILLILLNKRTIKKPAGGSDAANAFNVVAIAIKKNKWRLRKGYFDAAKPSQLALQGITTHGGKPITWNDDFVEDVRRTIEACEMFLFFPFYYLNDGGIGNIETSQGASMTTNGAPNDLLNNFNPLTIIVAIPIISYGLYPLLRKYKIHFGPIQRIVFGFLLAASSSIIGAITQWRVYKTSPCGYYATECTIGSGVSGISIWWQVPQYVLGALSECFANVTAYQLAYARSPQNMKGLVLSFFLFANALSAAIQEACTPSLNDPNLIWPFVATGVGGVLLAIWFWFLYRHLDRDEYARKVVIADPDQDCTERVAKGGSGKESPEEKV